MNTKIFDGQKFTVAGRAKVLAGVTPTNPTRLTLNSQHPFLVDVKLIVYSAGAISPADYGIKITASGQNLFPVTGSAEITSAVNDITFADSGGFAGMPPLNNMLDSGELNNQIAGPAYDLDIDFFNKSASDIIVFIWVRVTPKIELPDVPIAETIKETPQSLLNVQGPGYLPPPPITPVKTPTPQAR